MKQKILIFAILFSAIFVSFSIIAVNKIQAQSDQPNLSNIQYPVTELGNCTSQDNCKTYCDAPAHQDACLNFAQEHNLMTSQEINAARIVLSGRGPGGCTSKEICQAYCDNTDHINECIAFAQQNNLMSPDELAQAKKVQAAVAAGIKPPACGGPQKCDVYCSQPEHMQECLNFGLQAGLVSPQEAADAQKYLSAIEKGLKPLPCHGKEECDAYCQEESHFDECVNFSEAAGFMTPQDAEMARKTGGKGPGGCRGKEECDAYCKTNQPVCFRFALDHGLMSQEDLQKMKEGEQQMQQVINGASQDLLNCLNSKLGADKIEALKNLQPVNMTQQDGADFQSCAEKSMSSGESGPQHKMTFGDIINTVPPEIRGCVSSKLDPNILNENKDFSGTINQIARECSAQLTLPSSQNYQDNSSSPADNNQQMPLQNYQENSSSQQQPMQQSEQGQVAPGQSDPAPANQIQNSSTQSLIISNPLMALVLESLKFLLGK